MPTTSAPESIHLRGVRQNNLKGFDLDLPLGKFIVVTGLSGAGKSSLVFDTLHAEGQRRYVETFSAYTRQFLELLDKPKVDSIENIRPSIAIEQTNTVKTSRSTVGTMTELTDFAKVWFSHVAECHDPATGEKVEDDTPQTIWAKTQAAHPLPGDGPDKSRAGSPAAAKAARLVPGWQPSRSEGCATGPGLAAANNRKPTTGSQQQDAATLLLCFRITKPTNLKWTEVLTSIKSQGYIRALTPDKKGALSIAKLDELLAAKPDTVLKHTAHIFVIQDRLAIVADNKSRFLEATESALHFGKGEIHLFLPGDGRDKSRAGSSQQRDSSQFFSPAGHYSRGLHSPKTGRTFRPASPGMFSFNSPLGACPKCRGFGRVIDIDYRLAIPDHSVSIDEGAIRPWEGEIYGESKKDLLRFTKKLGIPTHRPFAALTPEQKAFVLDGSPGYDGKSNRWPKYWYGLKGFFRWMEKTTYKMHVRVFLSRYRAYNPCPDCHGARLQPEALCWKWRGHTLPQLYQLPIGELLALVASDLSLVTGISSHHEAHSASIAHDSIVTRLRYLAQVGLGYLTLDRTSRTLSGGEVQRVNLTSCLGTSLVDTLFVLDEPSVGLHPRDIDRLLGIIRTLTDAGNTVVVVEHDEAMIRAADHVIEVGPEPGARGGNIVFQGSVGGMLAAPLSITGAYCSGRQRIDAPARRRPAPTTWLRFTNASKHNVRNLSFRLPLQRFVCLSGVSGSGKSTLLDNIICQGLLTQRSLLTEDPAEIEAVKSDLVFSEVVLVDQSPLSRTPRSNPALYSEAWELIRELYATVPAAQAAGFSASSFSFNSGDGRCDNCQGLGSERVEMQFLSDVFVPCPICEGQRFKPEVRAITWHGHSIAGLLATTVGDSLAIFAAHPEIHRRLAALDEVGLGYLPLGQPLNTLSGGESQRLKLVRYLGDYASESALTPHPSRLTPPAGALLLLDEPTTGLHRHDVKRLLAVLQRIVDRGHSLVVIEHNLDVLKSADWILEVGPEAGAQGGRIVAAGTPEELVRADTATSPFLREALGACQLLGDKPALAAAEDAAPYQGSLAMGPAELTVLGARENNLKNISVSIPHRLLTVVTGVSGSGKSTLAFDIIFAEGQRRFMESMSPYARQFVEQLPRPDIDRLSGIPPTVAIEQRVTRGSRKSTVATITEVAQYLRLLYARLGIQHHPETGRAVTPLTPGQLRQRLEKILATPQAKKARHLYLCAPLIRGRKGHHEPMAKWIGKQGYQWMRADGRVLRVDNFQKLDRYKEHDVEVVVADLKNPANPKSRIQNPKWVHDQLATALRLGKGSCFLVLPSAEVLGWFSTTRTDILSGESFPELDPKHFSFNSPKGWCPTCRGHGRIYDWMLEERDDDAEQLPVELADLKANLKSEIENQKFTICPTCHGERLNRIARAVRLLCRATARTNTGRPAPRPARGLEPVETAGRNGATSQSSFSLPELLRLTPDDLLATLRNLQLETRGKLITQDIVPQIEERLRFLGQVGLDYLQLDRPTETLSGGEAQRIRLAAQLGSNLSGVLYVLDEPSIGLHARDNDRLVETLLTLRDKGNTVLVVEHDDVVMERADRIIDLGPGAGLHGGTVLANESPAGIKLNASSLTGLFLNKGIQHPLRGAYRELPGSVIARRPVKPVDEAIQPFRHAQGPEPVEGLDRRARRGRARDDNSAGAGWLELTGVNYRNLRNQTLHLPLGRLTMVCGPSGAGKSTLFRDILHPAVTCAIKRKKSKLNGKAFVRNTNIELEAGRPPFAGLTGAGGFKSVIEVDQSPIGKTPRSTPATYLGIFDLIRQFFASLPEAKMRGYGAGRFSFNVAGGRCETCSGAGRIKLEMAFMPDSYLPCDDCGGSRYGPELADIAWKGKTIGQVLQLSFDEAAMFFAFHSQLSQVCQLMVDCGLGYLTLGQSSPSLSGGEAQRLKLVTELAHGLQTYKERSHNISVNNLYLLEEPTIGLHLSDCEKLIRVLHNLVDQGHTVVVIEHHLDLLAEADYIVELGPNGGPAGGEIMYQGPLAGLLRVKRSPTAPYLREKLKRRPAANLA